MKLEYKTPYPERIRRRAYERRLLSSPRRPGGCLGKPASVYLIELYSWHSHRRLFKIGQSQNPYRRTCYSVHLAAPHLTPEEEDGWMSIYADVKAVSCKLLRYDALDCESALHNLFSDKAVGHELFELTDADAEFACDYIYSLGSFIK